MFFSPKSDSSVSCQKGAPTLSSIVIISHPATVSTIFQAVGFLGLVQASTIQRGPLQPSAVYSDTFRSICAYDFFVRLSRHWLTCLLSAAGCSRSLDAI